MTRRGARASDGAGRLLVLAAVLVAAGPAALAAQVSAPPPGGLVEPARGYALGAFAGWLRWDDAAPYEDAPLWGLAVERDLWSFVRGRASMGAGTSTLLAAEPVDAWIFSFDLQVVLAADVGPFRAAGVIPYALGGVGSLVTNPTGDGAGDLPTRSQSAWTWGGGVRARIADRWEARGEATVPAVRLADPLEGENRETETIHNLRWEGSVQWLF